METNVETRERYYVENKSGDLWAGPCQWVITTDRAVAFDTEEEEEAERWMRITFKPWTTKVVRL